LIPTEFGDGPHLHRPEQDRSIDLPCLPASSRRALARGDPAPQGPARRPAAPTGSDRSPSAGTSSDPTRNTQSDAFICKKRHPELYARADHAHFRVAGSLKQKSPGVRFCRSTPREAGDSTWLNTEENQRISSVLSEGTAPAPASGPRRPEHDHPRPVVPGQPPPAAVRPARLRSRRRPLRRRPSRPAALHGTGVTRKVLREDRGAHRARPDPRREWSGSPIWERRRSLLLKAVENLVSRNVAAYSFRPGDLRIREHRLPGEAQGRRGQEAREGGAGEGTGALLPEVLRPGLHLHRRQHDQGVATAASRGQ